MKGFFKFIAFIIIALVIQSFLANLFRNIQDKLVDCDEYSAIGDPSAKASITHQRFWKDLSRSSRFCMDYTYLYESFYESGIHRDKIKLPATETYTEYWGNVYRSLYQNDSEGLLSIEDSLTAIRNEKGLNRVEFAHMIVKFVQDIPYSYIMSETCEEIKDGKPCKGDSRFGILSPIEFLYTLKGDCDTRTVLLYGLLKDLGYEPLILISQEYLHSMLALNIPGAGGYISHNGKKFYFWETTNIGWEPGMIAPDMQNIRYWDIALSYDI